MEKSKILKRSLRLLVSASIFHETKARNDVYKTKMQNKIAKMEISRDNGFMKEDRCDTNVL